MGRCKLRYFIGNSQHCLSYNFLINLLSVICVRDETLKLVFCNGNVYVLLAQMLGV